eukprot:3556238-Prorocentrum_lima.AAC.1
MNESGTREQDEGVLDPGILESLSQELDKVCIPIITPPGGLVLSASSVGHAGRSLSLIHISEPTRLDVI